MKRWQWAIIAALAVAAVTKLVVFGEISPRQYAVLTASAGKSSEAWRNEVREILIYANGINELSYRRLLADLPAAEIGTVPANAPENKREALHNLVRALSFKD
ncbi:hypothetical protein G3A40_37360 [Paraburkholderia aspalathi]|uniref:hypothetical protein n=1 Tax=Paraburkholderia aspalathi TaxID=1324617 RepID=UPI00190BBF65|nr:hypothetical protein [Paraburkholderia aspalathi]MBK3865415.1 hypothetical protein [Paraburkholderia aspalathi]